MSDLRIRTMCGVDFTQIERLCDVPEEIQTDVQNDALAKQLIPQSFWLSAEGQLIVVVYQNHEQYYNRQPYQWKKYLLRSLV